DGVEIEDVLDRGQHPAERLAHLVEDAARALVATVRGVGDVADLAAGPAEIAIANEERVRPGERLDASAPAAPAERRVRPAIDRHVSDLAAEAVRAAMKPLLEHHAAAD